MAKYKYPRGAGWLPHAPAHLPPWEIMADDLAAAPTLLADHLDVARCTVYRWYQGTLYPRRAEQLAIFYETKYGRSFVATRAHNDAVMYGRSMMWLQDEVVRLRGLLSRVGQIGQFGSANDPAPEVPVPTTHQLIEAHAAMPSLMRRAR
jgi:hypothetical protein